MFSNRTALLVIDVQNLLVGEGPFDGPAFLLRLQSLIGACRQGGVEVIYVRHDDGPGTELGSGEPGWEIHPDVAPIPGERIFDKKFNSAFHKTALRSYLVSRDVQSLILVGMQTEYCIDATLKSAFDWEYRIIVPEGTNTTVDNDGLSGAEIVDFFQNRIWNRRFAEVLPWEDVLRAIESREIT